MKIVDVDGLSDEAIKTIQEMADILKDDSNGALSVAEEFIDELKAGVMDALALLYQVAFKRLKDTDYREKVEKCIVLFRAFVRVVRVNLLSVSREVIRTRRQLHRRLRHRRDGLPESLSLQACLILYGANTGFSFLPIIFWGNSCLL
ncbi:MAG: hypothetical protein HQK89_12005 [Nitrospirae bacterium]|nr:hypothetical protein [Nitrospirota bacterium]